MLNETFLVTGAMGCIGSWVLKNLVKEGVQVIAADLDTTPTRPALLMSSKELDQITWQQLDVVDTDATCELVRSNGITHVVHLAGLQIPFCKAAPALGSAVNVTGTVNVFEAVRAAGINHFSYASSLAVLGDDSQYIKRPLGDDVPLLPKTLYGVYKAANEFTAAVYWRDWDIGSVGLRPYCVYGVSRDQGMTADFAKAILAVAADAPFHIRFDGLVALQHANDVAQAFIASARSGHRGAAVCNLRGDVIEVSEFTQFLKTSYPLAELTHAENSPLPYPADLSDDGLRRIIGDVPHTPLETAVQQDFERYLALIEGGMIDLEQLKS
ncbi:MAG TPA: epimerase [Gemmatimonadetes bacterium]|nr:epimerase [Gemmatimonadota bacterium]